MLYECPTGKILRDAPHIYDLIDFLGSCEQAGPTELSRTSRYFLHALRIYRSETSRLMELRRNGDQTSRDAEYASRTLTARAT